MNPLRIAVQRALVALPLLLGGAAACHAQAFADIMRQLEEAIEQTAVNDSLHVSEIRTLEQELSQAAGPADRYVINHQLFKRYESYIADSAIVYANRNIALASQMGDSRRLAESMLDKASVLSKCGLFSQALDIQEAIDRQSLDDELLPQYFHNYFDLYQYLSEYTIGTEYFPEYVEKLSQYRDSTLLVSDESSFYYISLYPSYLTSERRFAESEEFCQEQIKRFPQGSREYSILASVLAYNYGESGDRDNQMLYLALSAVSDVKGSTKENMSLRALAEQLYADGDINHANLLLKKSVDDAVFFSSRLRNIQSSSVLPIIDSSYEAAQQSYNRRLQLMLILSGSLAVVLVFCVYLVWRQVRKAARINSSLAAARDEMSTMNDELKALNEQARFANSELQEANNIKEISIRYFIELCSASINSLEHYRAELYRKLKTGRVDELGKQLSSNQIVNEQARELYATFDTAFLSIFPDFVAEFNRLFPEGEGFEEAPDRLNTELRIYALIRMGISDSQKIASFLRCSVSTIYTYRSRVKNRSLYPRDLDDHVLKIGTVKQ